MLSDYLTDMDEYAYPYDSSCNGVHMEPHVVTNFLETLVRRMGLGIAELDERLRPLHERYRGRFKKWWRDQSFWWDHPAKD